MRRLAALAVVTLLLGAPVAGPFAAGVAAAAEKVTYKAPVDSPVVDPFRPPPEPWLAGNRGIDYAPGVGTPVKAAADGEVVFAGQVGGELHVVILHADGIRTSYSFLQSIAVHRGDKVTLGTVVGTAGDDLHFGARVGDTYIDPRTLFDAGPPHVFLVPDDVRRPGTVEQERSGLSRFLGALGTVGSAIRGAAGSGLDQFKGAFHYASLPVTVGFRFAQTTVDWWNQRNNCTPASVTPPPLTEHRVAVLVSGLGSSSNHDSLDNVDPATLGYDDSFRFSYNGEADPTYDSHDTTQELRLEAKRLHDLLAEVHRLHPGEPVDLIAHSQGGIIARTALAFEYDRADPLMPDVRHLVTLASPHQGTDAATALTHVGQTNSGSLIEKGLDVTGLTGFNTNGTSIHELAEGSAFMNKLNDTPLPDGISFTSIGSRGDLTVPGIHTHAPGAHNVIVSVPGLLSDHRNLPGSAQGRREVALAIADMPPTCQSLADMLTDTAVSSAISEAEDFAGGVATTATSAMDGGFG